MGKGFNVALVLFLFTFMEIMVVLMFSELPLVAIIWEQSGDTITKGDFMVFFFVAMFIPTWIAAGLIALKGRR